MPISLPMAIIGAAGVGAAGSVAGGILQSNAANKAIGAQQQMFGVAQQNLAPYNAAGQAALPTLEALTGTGQPGGPSASSIQSTLQGLPGYQFMLGQGLESTQNSFAAQGLGGSGAALKGAANFSEGLASANLGQFYNMLLGQSQLGAGAAGGVAQAATTAGQGIAQSTQNVGTAQAAGATGVGNSLAGGVNNYLQYSILSQLLNRGNPAPGVFNTNETNLLGTVPTSL